jgi:hypothetical protein
MAGCFFVWLVAVRTGLKVIVDWESVNNTDMLSVSIADTCTSDEWINFECIEQPDSDIGSKNHV